MHSLSLKNVHLFSTKPLKLYTTLPANKWWCYSSKNTQTCRNQKVGHLKVDEALGNRFREPLAICSTHAHWCRRLLASIVMATLSPLLLRPCYRRLAVLFIMWPERTRRTRRGRLGWARTAYQLLTACGQAISYFMAPRWYRWWPQQRLQCIILHSIIMEATRMGGQMGYSFGVAVMKCSIRNFDVSRTKMPEKSLSWQEIIINYTQSIDQSEDDCSVQYRTPPHRVGQVCVCWSRPEFGLSCGILKNIFTTLYCHPSEIMMMMMMLHRSCNSKGSSNFSLAWLKLFRFRAHNGHNFVGN